MFSFLKKKKSDPRYLEQLIFDIAEHQRDEDFQLLYKLMVGREIFFDVDSSSLPDSVSPGFQCTTQATDHVKMGFITMPNHGDWSSATTLPSHPSLSAVYAGMPWLEFLEMTLKMPQLQGAVLQGAKSWIAFDKERIRSVLSETKA